MAKARDEQHFMSETVVPGLERRLKAELTGEVMFEPLERVATPRCVALQIMPLGVVAPRTIEEASGDRDRQARKRQRARARQRNLASGRRHDLRGRLLEAASPRRSARP